MSNFLSHRYKILLFYFLVFILSLLITELTLRVILYNKINSHFSSGMLWIQNQTISKDPSEVDKKLGIDVKSHPNGQFRSNAVIDITVIKNHLDKKNNFQFDNLINFSVKLNNLGLMSESDYHFERNNISEFRILILGESFTGPTTSTYQWVDTLEDLLNNNKKLKKFLNVEKVKVYNLGWIGGGFGTFWKEYDEVGRLFGADLAVVNYIELDYPRHTSGKHLSDEDEMVQFASTNLEKISQEIDTIATIMPSYADFDYSTSYHKSEALASLRPEVDFYDMRNFMNISEPNRQREEYTNVPFDAHYSDRGGEFYSRALASVITEKIMNQKYDYSKYTSKYFNDVVGEDKPKTRKIANSTMKIVKNEDDFRSIIQTVYKSYLKTRLLRVKPYIFDVITNSGVDGINIPFTKGLEGSFIEFKYGKEGKALMNIMCTSKPYSLNNPDCYTYMHTFVNGKD